MTRVPDDEWDGELIIHNLPRPEGLIEVDTVADIGAGIRPMNWYKPRLHLCVEPHKTYAERLQRRGHKVIPMTAFQYLKLQQKIEAIYLLDVIEHMEKHDGFEVIDLMTRKATKQVVVYTPRGFMEQTTDDWGLDGEIWQTHRSGWTADDFPDWHIENYGRGFFAVLTI